MTDPLPKVLSKLGNLKKSNGQYIAQCPAHEDNRPSLSVSSGKDGEVLLHCFAGCSMESIIDKLGLEFKDLFRDQIKSSTENDALDTYDYVDEKGSLLYQALRYPNKRFSQRRPDGAEGWIYDLKDTRRVIYNLPNVIKGIKDNQPIFIVEGEKDANNLIALGLIATTNSGGAGNWNESISGLLKGSNVVLIPDNDKPGREHGKKVASLISDQVSSIKIVELPDLNDKEDVTDWLRASHTKEELLDLVSNREDYKLVQTNKEATKGPFALPLDDFLSSGSDSVEWLVPELIPRQSIVILASRPKAGKSLLTFNIALGLRRGEVLGRPCDEAKTLILQLEDPPPLIRDRINKMKPEDGIFIRAGLGTSSEDLLMLPEFIKDNEIDLVVIDPLIFAAGGADENAAPAMSKLFLKLRELAFDSKVTILVVHHHRKSAGEHGEGIRGSSAILGAVDVALELKRDNDETPTATLNVTSRFSSVESETLVLDVDNLTWQSRGSERSFRDSKREREILSVLEDEGECSIEDIEEVLGITKAAFYPTLKKLVKEVKVIERKVASSQKGGRPRIAFSKAVRLQNPQKIGSKLQNLGTSDQQKQPDNRFSNPDTTLGVQDKLQNLETEKEDVFQEDLNGFEGVPV